MACSGIGLFNPPGENSAEIVMTTASTEYVLNATNNSNISLMTLTNENGSINISEYVNNPANTTTSSGSGFAELAIPRFIVINATQNIESNLSWAYLRIYYNSTDLPATLDESTIVIYYFNETTSRWQAEVDSGVDASNNYAWANVSHFSVYSVGGSAEEDEDTPVTSSGSSGGGGGGGGGGGSSDVSVVPSSQGSTIKITLGDKVILKHGGVDYKFSVSTAKSGMVTLRSLMYSDTVTVIGVDKPNYDVDKDGKNDITLQISYTTGNYVYITVYKYEDNSFTFTPIMPSFPTKKKTLTKTVEKKADVTAPKTSIPINNKTQLNKSINQSALAKFQTNFRNSKAFYWIITGAWIGVVMLLLTFIVAQVYTRYLEDPDSFWFKKKKKNKDDEEEMKIM